MDKEKTRNTKPTLLVMAAGMGSRYGGLKQMDRLSESGEIMLDFSVYDAMLAGFDRAVFVIKRENEADFRKLIDGRCGKHIEVEYAFQELSDLPWSYEFPKDRQKPWGTGQAVLAARKLIDGPFAVINSDDYYGPLAFQLVYDFLCGEENRGKAAGASEKLSCCMVGYTLEKTLSDNGGVSRGVCATDVSGRLKSISETHGLARAEDGKIRAEDGSEFDGKTPVSMNFWGFPGGFMGELWDKFPAFLDTLYGEGDRLGGSGAAADPLKAEYQLPTVVSDLMDEKKAEVRLLGSDEKWYGVTYREDKEDVAAALQRMKDAGLYPEKLWK